MTDLPILPDWVLLEAAKQCGWSDLYTLDTLQRYYANDLPYRALCDMIAKHEQKPVDRKLLCAREAAVGWAIELDSTGYPKRDALWDYGVRAIELWIEGYGE